MRAFRRADTDVRQMLEDSRPRNVYPEAQQYVDLLKEAQQWRLNFGFTAPRTRFLRVAQLAAEAFTNLAGEEKGYEAKKAAGEFIKELLPLMTDWGAPQAATA